MLEIAVAKNRIYQTFLIAALSLEDERIMLLQTKNFLDAEKKISINFYNAETVVSH